MKRLLAITLLLSGNVLFGQKAGGSDEDGRISDQVRMRLAGDVDVKGGADDVTVAGGVVTIKGRVDTERGKQKATRLAKKIKGVKDVDNQLVVGPPTP